MPKNNGFIWFLILPILVIIDQCTKFWVVNNLQVGDTLRLFPSFQFTLAENKGIAFSLLSSNQPLMQYALIAMIAAICLFLVVLLVRTPREDGWSRCGIALMIGGALGNLADRIIYGHVVDFIDFHIGHWHWYTFNLADAFITVGAIMMAKSIFFPSPALKGKE